MSVCECVYKSIPPHIFLSSSSSPTRRRRRSSSSLFTQNNKTIPFDFRFAFAALFSPLIETVEVNSFSYHLSTSSFNFLLLIFLPPGVSPISLSLSAVIQDTHTDKQVREKNLYKIIIPTVEHFEKKNNFQDNPKKSRVIRPLCNFWNPGTGAVDRNLIN